MIDREPDGAVSNEMMLYRRILLERAVGGRKWRDVMKQPWRALDEWWSVVLSSLRLALHVLLLTTCVCYLSFCHLRHPAGESGKANGGGDDDVGETVRAGVMDSIENGHNLRNDDFS